MDAVLCQEKVGPWRLNPGGRPRPPAGLPSGAPAATLTRTALSASGSCQPQLTPVASVVVMLTRSCWLGARPFFRPGSVFGMPNGLTDVVRASVQRI